MKFLLAISLLSAVAFSGVNAECTETKEIPLDDAAKKLSFSGFEPEVKRTLNSGVGNKIILKNYDYEPVVREGEDGVLQVSLGEPCEGGETATNGDGTSTNGHGTATNGDGTSANGDSASSAASKVIGLGIPVLFGLQNGVLSSALTLGLVVSLAPTSFAQDTITATECELAPIEVEIYVDTMVTDIVTEEYKTGEYEVCPPETMYWEHAPEVHGGYTGCVAERGLYPCPSDALGVNDEDGEFYKMSPVYWDGEQCVDTEYTIENRTLWTRGGHPMDKFELNKRTGLNPVVTLPFTRMPYPSYRRGEDVATSQDESSDARVKVKEMLEYIGAWTKEELANWDVTITEGAEQGMVHLYAGKALEIARTTCNRNIYVLNEAPGYGYSNSAAAAIANTFSDSFYNSSECLCFEDDSCKEPTVTITSRGWLPFTDHPVEVGGDNVTYSAVSDSPSSPWFESLVFPENPSGVFKIPQLPNANRRVCDGVYLWPMYMGKFDFVIPKDRIPECSAWASSISKIYSAAARAGWIMYNNDPVTSHDAMVDAIGTSQTLTHGSLSQWTWQGQMQLMDVFMSRPLDDPTSWIGAYSSIIKEKWDAIIEGFEDCPVVEVSNPYSGAYVWFVFKDPYLGIQQESTPSFFREVLGLRAYTYNWGWRGADPADYYGEGYGVNDFTRMQVYRDISIYKELGRRASIVCNDLDASIGGDMISINQWVDANEGTRERRLTEGYENREDRKRHLKEVVPELTERQLEFLSKGQEESEVEDLAVASCAPEYTTECLYERVENFF